MPTADRAIARRIDEMRPDGPFTGGRMLHDLLRGEGIVAGQHRLAAMMRRTGAEALSRWPHLPIRAVQGQRLPRGLASTAPA